MNKLNSKLIPLYELNRLENLDSEIANISEPMSLVMQAGNLWKLSKTPMHSVLSLWSKDDKDEFLNAEFGEPVFDTTNTYLLENHWSEFKLDRDQIRYVMKYFRDIYAKYGVEACVLLLLSIEKKEWKVLCVPQLDCSSTSVNYLQPVRSLSDIPADNPKYNLYSSVFSDTNSCRLMKKARDEYDSLTSNGYRIMGTIHSHCDFSAFHSGVDDNDEKNFDGLHITIGNVNSNFSFSARYSIAQSYWPIDLEEYFGDLSTLADNIDEIIIDPYHMELMQPTLGRQERRSYFWDDKTTKNKKQWSYSDNLYQEYESWDSNDFENTDITYNEELVENNLFDEDECIRLFDVIEGKAFIVKRSYYINNPTTFNSEKFIEIDSGEIPEEVLSKHTEDVESSEFDLELTNKVNWINDHRLNIKYSSNNDSFKSSSEVQSSDLCRKAKKK